MVIRIFPHVIRTDAMAFQNAILYGKLIVAWKLDFFCPENVYYQTFKLSKCHSIPFPLLRMPAIYNEMAKKGMSMY